MRSKSIKVMIAGILAVPMIALGISLVSPAVHSVPVPPPSGMQNGADSAQGTNTPNDLFTGNDPIFKTITNAALFIIGAISVLMLIYGGIRYTISGGNEKSVTAAKNTILYAVVGIIVALLAYAIVNFVLTSLIPTS